VSAPATILVTGGTGFLGKHVLKALAAAGRAGEVRALVRQRARSIERLGIAQVDGDVTDEASLAAAIRGVTHVLHLAGMVSRHGKDVSTMMRVHVDGTRRVFDAARAQGVARVVLASSSGTIAVSTDAETVTNESAPFAYEVVKGWPYYLSKIYQEQLALRYVAEHQLPIVILNPSLLLGPGDSRGSSTEDVRKFLQKKIPIVPDGGVNFVDVRDAAAAFVAALERGRVGERYLLGGPNWTMETFFGRLSRLAKVPAPRLKVPAKWAEWGATLLQEFADWRGTVASVDPISVEMAQHFWYCDSSKAERELGFLARDPQETLLDTIRYVRKHFLAEPETTFEIA
jgi:dihydroflavonol-4-reductase